MWVKLTIKARKNVLIIPPKKPSQVFFGDSLIRGVFPSQIPKI